MRMSILFELLNELFCLDGTFVIFTHFSSEIYSLFFQINLEEKAALQTAQQNNNLQTELVFLQCEQQKRLTELSAGQQEVTTLQTRCEQLCHDNGKLEAELTLLRADQKVQKCHVYQGRIFFLNLLGIWSNFTSKMRIFTHFQKCL